jgi:ornithine cyclodeaminase
MVRQGAHVNAVGAITPEREEFHQEILSRAGLVAADSLAAVQKLSKEFMTYYDDGPGDWSDVRSIGSLVAEGWSRPADVDLTLFKAMGMGISDLSLGSAIYQRAREAGMGRSMPHPARMEPRLRPGA